MKTGFGFLAIVWVFNLDDPNDNYSKIPGEMRQMLADERSVAQTLDNEQAGEFRMEMLEQVGPAIQRNQARFQETMEKPGFL